ncbi:MAG: NAD(P)/FAD-dependent oxidoreductase [Myxococcota bacterium]|nr:NAD(P)/FAD-dependent oxidoreductase [Myxococcota bacterium]
MAHFDVVIVGAGLSGIGAAYHLQQSCPKKSYAILESRDAIGGTWDLYRYPGIRSDSDMHTLGYGFKPWREAKAIADGPSILAYVNETADENDIRKHILFDHRLETATWSSDEARWSLDIAASDRDSGEPITCNFLLMCSGYYSYDEPYRPHLEGEEDFEGPLFHPQLWPEDLDYRGKRVVVIGSGATAMTLVPAMAGDAEHVTMLQRSPTYVISLPDQDRIANTLRRFLPDTLAYRITRAKNVALQRRLYQRTRTAPERVKNWLLGRVRKALGPDYDVEKHFTPSYDPWDQRLCLIPNDDLFEAIKSGKASVVTDQIDRVTKRGIRLESGEELDADIIVAATGLNLKLLGGVQFSVDGEAVHFPSTFTYKGMMYSDVPNLVQTFGYINASWTLRADLTAEYSCRLLEHMDELGMRQCTPRLLDDERDMPKRLWIEDFSAGYMQRVMHLFPRQGDREPWLNTQNYYADRKMIRHAPLEDGRLVFSNPG